ncbi:alpha/beta fold hydrolase [Herbidospora sp. NEAU-GS84]|uniref:Alpha/beta fold hydrolase n=1 Tax=Herbidospora solisilvae TaxID=2696284 RepID=A0A7C9NME1_9ACTN|nr:alpha/beta fold hydrolase [Herbidospora solisilvae]NAS26292.1 alpha/beta fold hydrolase [Herbidospora solisilvae]
MKTFLLIHGAWHDGRVWDRVVPLLTEAGHRVLAPSLTGHGDRAHLLGPDVGLDTHIADVLAVLTEEDLTDVILVGHSYAGMIVPAVAGRAPDRVSGLVYVDAMVPADGESVLDVMPFTQHLIDAAGSWRIPPMDGFFGVTDPADVEWLRPMLSDEPVRCFQQPVRFDEAVVAAIPQTHVHCVGDAPGVARRPVPPGARVWELRTGHDCMVTAPEELAELLLKAS